MDIGPKLGGKNLTLTFYVIYYNPIMIDLGELF